jgi:cytochrome c553
MAGGLKLGGLAVLGSGLVVIVVTLGLFAFAQMRLNAHVSADADHIDIPTDISAVQHGQHIAGAIALCTQCHGPTLTGGVVFDDDSGRAVAPNLTRAGLGTTFQDADYVRAIRYGLDPSGRQLWGMPSDDYNRLTDGDLATLIAYLKSLPPNATALPDSQIRLLGLLLFATGEWDLLPGEKINRLAPRPAAVSVDLSPAYGQYLTAIAGCARCHGPGLAGGVVPSAAPGTAPRCRGCTTRS